MGTIKQLSVFLENKSGRLNEVLDILGAADIRIVAATVADTTEYGILRIITSDTDKAVQSLKAANVSANTNDVIALQCDSGAGTLAAELKKLAQEAISIEYMYCFSQNNNTVVIIRTNNRDAALVAIEKHHMRTVSEKELIHP